MNTKKTAYVYICYSNKSSDYRIVINDISFSNSKPMFYDYNIRKYVNWHAFPILKKKNCPHSINEIMSKEDVILFNDFLNDVIKITKKMFLDYKPSVMQDIRDNIHQLNGLFPKVLAPNILIYNHESLKNLLYVPLMYTLTRNKQTIHLLLDIARRYNVETIIDDECNKFLNDENSTLNPSLFVMMYFKNNKLHLTIYDNKQTMMEYKINNRLYTYRKQSVKFFKECMIINCRKILFKHINDIE